MKKLKRTAIVAVTVCFAILFMLMAQASAAGESETDSTLGGQQRGNARSIGSETPTVQTEDAIGNIQDEAAENELKDFKKAEAFSPPVMILTACLLAILIIAAVLFVQFLSPSVSKKKKQDSVLPTWEEKENCVNTVANPPAGSIQRNKTAPATFSAPARQPPKAAGLPITIRICVYSKDIPATNREKRIAVNGSLSVGRSGECGICISDRKLSRRHFSIDNRNGSLSVRDLGSTNGTLLNGKRLTGSAKLKENDTIMAGLSKFRITAIS